MNKTKSRIMIGDKLQHLMRVNGFGVASLVKGSNINESTLQDHLKKLDNH
ncbi:hypothetical protein ACFQ3N_19625 [Virgibacillus byunsanensis]|uniref:Uncharacterized protein n=1 Tax=Virgibacillus byunsanensis TaxID=570945 RepID=A0ABW3LQB0_9BACI